MCHRFNILTQPKTLAGYFDAIVAGEFDEAIVTGGKDRYPLFEAAVIREDSNAGLPRQLCAMSWGLVPRWLPDSEDGKKYVRKYSTFNARCETVHQKRSFSQAFAKRRCLVPVGQFFEPPNCWFTVSDQSVMALAGIWEPARSRQQIDSFTILTTEANELVGAHRTGRKRMPVMLGSPEDQHDWLDSALTQHDSLAHLFQPFDSDRMDVHFEQKLK